MAKATKKQRKQRKTRVLWSIVGLLAITMLAIYLSRVSIPVLQPAGPIAAGEKRLLIISFLLMLIVVIPVFALTFGFAWRYREARKATYKPDWDHSRAAETVWWLVPSALIVVLSVMTWHSTYAYDPYKPIAAKQPALNIDVVALDWRWLFIYPKQQVASINELVMPVGTPVTFHITADAPMNSFWIPQLGGQMYAMPGMESKLNLMASRQGTYLGRSANISGKGFAKMKISAKAVSMNDFTAWSKTASSRPTLSAAMYDELAKPSLDVASRQFGKPESNLFQLVISKYMQDKPTVAAIKEAG